MSENFSFDLSSEVFEKMIKSKESMGFSQKSWNEWFENILSSPEKSETDSEIIEKIIRNNALDSWYDQWITNFALNLDNIWDGNSAVSLRTSKSENSSALVIGRGPSIKKNNQLEIIAKSDFKGSIICTDGNLPNVLNAGIDPEKFNLFTITIDAQENQKKIYENQIVKQYGDKIKCIFSTTAHHNAYLAAKDSGMEIFWIHTLFDYEEGKKSFNKIQGIMSKAKDLDKKIPAIQTGANVGTSAWVVGWSILNCNHVGLIGLDLGYDDSMSWDEINYHGYKMPDNIDTESKSFKRAYPTIYNPDFDCYCKQDPLFLYYCNALKEFIQKSQNRVKTINATEGGALFGEGIHCTTLKNFLTTYNFT